VRLFVAENGTYWFVIHTYSGYEERVKKNLEQRIKFMDSGSEILKVVIPTEDEMVVVAVGRVFG
jgi:transcriptional antiterminator NusG